MTNASDNPLFNTKEWFNRAVPNPTPTSIRVQLGCHLEEIHEMLDLLAVDHIEDFEVLHTAQKTVKLLADRCKTYDLGLNIQEKSILQQDLKVEFLDSLCDQIVTAVGLAHMMGFDILGALTEVNDSNFSKFDDDGNPIFDPNGKIMKGPNYRKPDLKPYIAPAE